MVTPVSSMLYIFCAEIFREPFSLKSCFSRSSKKRLTLVLLNPTAHCIEVFSGVLKDNSGMSLHKAIHPFMSSHLLVIAEARNVISLAKSIHNFSDTFNSKTIQSGFHNPVFDLLTDPLVLH